MSCAKWSCGDNERNKPFLLNEQTTICTKDQYAKSTYAQKDKYAYDIKIIVLGRDTVNKLYYGDNLDVLRRHIKDETVDLVYLDPPFNSNATSLR
jgi:16S rRNA G966 N2-methylase RsmD